MEGMESWKFSRTAVKLQRVGLLAFYSSRLLDNSIIMSM